MTTQGETGTGKHPHKSAAEPFEHHGKGEASHGKAAGKQDHEAAPAKGAGETKQTGKAAETSGGGQGTGKHPHKSAAEPYEHHGKAK